MAETTVVTPKSERMAAYATRLRQIAAKQHPGARPATHTQPDPVDRYIASLTAASVKSS